MDRILGTAVWLDDAEDDAVELAWLPDGAAEVALGAGAGAGPIAATSAAMAPEVSCGLKVVAGGPAQFVL
jgi:hypothetical protein